MPEDRRYLKGAFREVAERVHAIHPDFPSPAKLTGLEDPISPRVFVTGHPRASRLALVKFLPTGPDGTRMNHGIGVDIWVSNGIHLRGWSHGKGDVEMTFQRDPSVGDYVDALIYVARWAGLLFGGSQELMDWSTQRKKEPKRDLVELAKERTS
jgi:hypothetical protein